MGVGVVTEHEEVGVCGGVFGIRHTGQAEVLIAARSSGFPFEGPHGIFIIARNGIYDGGFAIISIECICGC